MENADKEFADCIIVNSYLGLLRRFFIVNTVSRQNYWKPLERGKLWKL